MCGIVGYIGKEQAAPILLEGLERLEYRGYDSAGICVAENGVLKSGFTRESLHQLLTKRLITASEETTIGKVARKIPFLKRHHKDDGKEKDNAQKSLEEPTEKDITEESEQRH